MMSKVLALSLGVVMLSGVGIAQADTVADPLAPTKVQQTTAQSKLAIDQPGRAPGRLVLTDAQLSELTAGHNKWYPHFGYYKRWVTTNLGRQCLGTRGWHTGGTGC
jgi:hypothetical protein